MFLRQKWWSIISTFRTGRAIKSQKKETAVYYCLQQTFLTAYEVTGTALGAAYIEGKKTVKVPELMDPASWGKGEK